MFSLWPAEKSQFEKYEQASSVMVAESIVRSGRRWPTVPSHLPRSDRRDPARPAQAGRAPARLSHVGEDSEGEPQYRTRRLRGAVRRGMDAVFDRQWHFRVPRAPGNRLKRLQTREPASCRCAGNRFIRPGTNRLRAAVSARSGRARAADDRNLHEQQHAGSPPCAYSRAGPRVPPCSAERIPRSPQLRTFAGTSAPAGGRGADVRPPRGALQRRRRM